MSIRIDGTNTAANPGITGADADTGLQFGTDEVNIVTGGTTQATVDSSGRLLVGTSSGSTNARAVIAGDTLSNPFSVFDLHRTTAATASGDAIGYIRFTDSATTSNSNYAYIRCDADGDSSSGTDNPGRLVFSTTADGASSPTERMRISASGQVRIEKDGDHLFLKQSSGNFGWVQSADQGSGALRLFRHNNGSNTEVIRFNANGSIQHNNDNNNVNGFASKSSTGGTFAFLAQQGSTDTVRIQHDGNCMKPGGGAWNAISDARAKEEIADYTAGLAELKQLEPRSYKYIGQDENTYYGLIAQECEGVMPEMAMKGVGKLPDGTEVDDYRVLNTTPLTFALINAVKELSAQNAALEARLTALEGGAAQ